MTLPTFIARWTASAAAERANYQLFLSELCDALQVPRPDPTVADETANAYVFEKAVPLPAGSTGRIDLYRRGCFVLEAKQGGDQPAPAPALSQQAEQQCRRRKRGAAPRGTTAWDTAMERARKQAQRYARALPAEEIGDGRPPLLLVVDVGQSIALYSEWTRSGGSYLPFPGADAAQQARIRAVAEELDAHRKRQQAAHPRLTLTDIYNVLAKLPAGEPLDKKDKTVHEQGLVSVLRQLHDELDALVAAAYGWPADLPEDEILARVVALNAQRAAEEAAGVVRWLRPAYQSPSGLRITGYELPAAHPSPLHEPKAEYVTRLPWPERLAEQAQAVRDALAGFDGTATAEQVAAGFIDAPAERVAEVLEMLTGLGQARMEERPEPRYAVAS